MKEFLKENLAGGDQFIDINLPFDEITLNTVVDDGSGTLRFYKSPTQKQRQTTIFPTEPEYLVLEEYNGKIFPNLSQPVNKFNECNDTFILFTNFQNEIVRHINSLPGKKTRLEDIYLIFQNTDSIDRELLDSFLKLSLSFEILICTIGKHTHFSLGDFVKKGEDKKRFLECIADEIISKSERIELLVKHNGTKGNYRELLLRSILEKYIPQKYKVATGFIEGSDRQCDIIIYDSHNYSPFFQEGDLVVVPAESVRAIIEVKTTLDSNEIKEALHLIADVSKAINLPLPFFKAIFAFKTNYKNEKSLINSVKKFYNHSDTKKMESNTTTHLFETISAVCVLGRQCIVTDVVDYINENDTIEPRIYSINSTREGYKVHSAAFLSELFSYLDVDNYAKSTNNKYFKELDHITKYDIHSKLYTRPWSVSYGFHGEFSGTDPIRKRVNDVILWRSGKLRSEDVISKYTTPKYF